MIKPKLQFKMLNIYHKLSTSKLIVGTRAAVAVKKKMFLKIIP